MAKKKVAYVVSVGLRPGVYTNWLDAAPQVLNVPGSIYKGYATLAEARDAYYDAEASGRVRIIQGDSSDDSDDLHIRVVPPHPRPNRYRDLEYRGVASPMLAHMTRTPTPQLSSAGRSTSSRGVQPPSNRRGELSSPSTGVTAGLSDQLSYMSFSPRSERREMPVTSPSMPHIATHNRHNSVPTSSPAHSRPSPLTGQTQVIHGQSLSLWSRLSPPTEVTQIESGHSRRSQSRHSSRQVTSSSTAGAYERYEQHNSHNEYDYRMAHMQRDAIRSPSVQSYSSSHAVRSPPRVARDVVSTSRINRRTSSISSPTTAVTKVEPSPNMTSSTQYPATTSSSQYPHDTTSSHRALSPILHSAVGSPAIIETRSWSPATDVTYDEPSSPGFEPTPVPRFTVEVDPESDHEHEEHTYATAPSSPCPVDGGDDSESDIMTYASPPSSFTLRSPHGTRIEPTALSAALSRISNPIPHPKAGFSRSSATPISRRQEQTHIRRAYSEAKVQTDVTTPRRTRTEAEAQTDAPSHNQSHCGTCQQPLHQVPQRHQPGPGTRRCTGDETEPASPIIPSKALGFVPHGSFSANALGLTQSEHIVYASNEPAFDPRSPLGRSASLPAGAPGPSFSRPSPRLYDGRISTLVCR